MASWTAVVLGAAGLAVADAVVSHPTTAARVGGIPAGVAKLARDFISVTTPGLPAPKTSTSTGGAS